MFGLTPRTFTIFDLDTKDSLTILISISTLIVTVIVNIVMQAYWNRRKLAADLKSKSRIEWIQSVRDLTAELLSTYYRVLAYERLDLNSEPITKAINNELVSIGYKPIEDNKKELLTIAQEKTQLLMLYYGSDGAMDPFDFDVDKAREHLTSKDENLGIKRLCVWIDKNSGKNKWISSLLYNTYILVMDAFDDEEDLNYKIKKAEDEHSKALEEFIHEATRLGFMYDNVKAEMWKKGEDDNKTVDSRLLKANSRLNALDNQKRKLYERLGFVRESTSIYLKHEWDRAKKGK